MGEMPMAPPPMDPAMMAPPPMDPAMMAPPAPDPSQELMATEQRADAGGEGIGALFADQVATALESAEEPKEVIDAIRGNDVPLESRYQELADYVGEEDALATPPSVLTMVQPTIMMTEEGAVNSGIGDLMQNITEGVEMETAEGVATPMAEGVGSLMMGVEQPLTQNFRQGGPVVQRFNEGGEGISNLDFLKVPTVKELYPTYLPMYQEALGTGQSPEQAKSQILFNIAQMGLGLAGGVSPEGVPLTGSPAQKLAQLTASLPKTVQQIAAQAREGERAAKVAALQAATAERDRLQEANLKQQQLQFEASLRLVDTLQQQDFAKSERISAQAHEMDLTQKKAEIQKARDVLLNSNALDRDIKLSELNKAEMRLDNQLQLNRIEKQGEETRKNADLAQKYDLVKLEKKADIQLALQNDQQAFTTARDEINNRFTADQNKLTRDFEERKFDSQEERAEAKLEMERAVQELQIEKLKLETETLKAAEENKKLLFEKLGVGTTTTDMEITDSEGDPVSNLDLGNVSGLDPTSAFGTLSGAINLMGQTISVFTQRNPAEETVAAMASIEALRGEAVRQIQEANPRSTYRLKEPFKLLIQGIPVPDSFKDLNKAAEEAKLTVNKLLNVAALLESEIAGETLALQTQAAGIKIDPTKFGELTRKIKLAQQLKETAGEYYVMKERLERDLSDPNRNPNKNINNAIELYKERINVTPSSDNERESEEDLTEELDQFSNQ